MSDYIVGQRVKISYCYVRQELTGQVATITALPSREFAPCDFADNYELPSYHVDIDPDFRPIDDQLTPA